MPKLKNYKKIETSKERAVFYVIVIQSLLKARFEETNPPIATPSWSVYSGNTAITMYVNYHTIREKPWIFADYLQFLS